MSSLREVAVTRYIEPLKEGGSLPGLVEADDGFKYVVKWKGAGQGYKALIAEMIGGLLAKALGLKVPELVIAYLDRSFGRAEPDPEIQDLLKASEGNNLGLHFLSGAAGFDPVAGMPDELLASKIVWMDAYILNVDRTAKNTNMLFWKNELWLIDHGASLFFHHHWNTWQDYITTPFERIKNHVLIHRATRLEEVDKAFRALLQEEIIAAIIKEIPEEWLQEEGDLMTPLQKREAYVQFLKHRLDYTDRFINAANRAR